ncbi:replication factor A protein 1-like [Solanum pennellii]|uniref:Replication factor A protein 1-like n=1 Tax=Solanum pennellii TaxID=28526 RepID=A0ABM1GSW4_SOLPN|nr:replication factor A protein 1-like [Solanum pennellii]
MAYSLLSDLDATREDWLIRVRVCRQWEFINYKRSPDMISLDMILIDEKGTLMHAIIWKNQVNKFRDKLSEGFAVIIRNFKVSALTGDYRPVQSNFKITFLRKTAIQKLQDDIVHIPQNGFQFIQPEIIRSRINNNILLSESVGSKWKKRDIHILTDPEDLTIKARITLWKDHGESLYPYVYPNDFGPYIVILTATTVKEFRGELTFATTAASKIYVNLKMDNITALLHKFSKKSVDVVTIASGNSSNVPNAQAMFENRMTVAELLDSEWSPDIEECVVTLRAQITAIENFFDWYYISCNFCNKKVESSNGVYTCQKCNKQCDLPLIRFKIHINVKDNGGNTTLVLFNGVAEKLLDTSAHKLVNRLSKSETNIPPQIQSLCGMELVFKLKLSSFNLKEGLENYTVTKVYVPDEELELQHRINKDKRVKGKEKFEDSTEQTDFNAERSNTYYSKELSDEEDTFFPKQRVYSRKLKKRRNLFIADSEESDGDTIKRTK